MEKAIICKGISKYFNKERKDNSFFDFFRKPEKIKVLDSITFSVNKGEIYGILGPNGSGKSTLIRIISTLLIPDEGKGEIYGLDVVRDCYRIRQFINRVSVEAAFFKKLTVMENIIFFSRLYGLSPKEAVKRSSAVLKELDLKEEKFNSSMESLSRGQQQKVAIVRALITEPLLLLLDEPTTGLDPKAKKDVQRFLLEVREKIDITIILTTHDMDEADRLCDRIAIIKDGKFIAEDTPLRLKMNGGNCNGTTLEEVFLQMTEETAA